MNQLLLLLICFRAYTNRSELIQKFLEEIEREEENEGDDEIDDCDDIDFVQPHTETDDHNSDSELDMEPDENETGDIAEDDLEGLRFYIGTDGETIWSNKTTALASKTKSKNIIKTIPGPKGQARQCKTELECFLQIFTKEIIDEIVKFTNIFINKTKAERENISSTEVRERDYRLTSKAEILALLGALFLMAIKRGNRADISEYFCKNGTGLMILRANFSENRFRFLLRSLRFDDIHSRAQRMSNDKLAPIRDFLNNIIYQFQSSYSLSEFATIDEMLVAFRGRCSFIQYMSKKPAKYGLKVYALCDAQTYYTYNLEVYCGTQKPGPYVCSNKPFDVVVRLVDPIKKSHRNLTTDNYFSSYKLSEHLLSLGITFLGTLRKNKREIPPEFVTTSKYSVPGSYKFACQEDKSLVSLVTKKKKCVLLLSTMHDEDKVDEETGKPVQVADYNVTKGGVDVVDLMCSRITTARRTQRWPMCIFFRLLDISGINSMRIFQFNNPFQKSNRRSYIYELSLALMKENLMERSKLKNLPKDIGTFLEGYKEAQPQREANQPPIVVQQNQRAICYICGSKKNHRTQLICKECGKYVCKAHSGITCSSCQENVEECD